jgi:hypothetical protein
MKKTARPLVFMINGKVEAVILDRADYLDTVASIRRGLAQAQKVRGAG